MGEAFPHTHARGGMTVKISPAYPAYAGWLSRYLGLHFWMVSNWRWAFASLGALLCLVALLVLSLTDALFQKYRESCCYPPDAPAGDLGSCEDENARVHLFFDKASCAAVEPIRLLLVSLALVVALVPIYLGWSKAGRAAFNTYAEAQVQRVVAKATQTQNSREAADDLLDEHPLFWVIVLLPEAFLTGSIFSVIRQNVLRWVYVILLWVGAILAFVFIGPVTHLDAAWHCYPTNAHIKDYDKGPCNNATSDASTEYSGEQKRHTHFFWITLGLWGGCHLFVIVSYLVTLCRFRKEYRQRIIEHLMDKTK